MNAAFPNLPIGNAHCDNVLTAKANSPCLIELIWSYWHEEGMLVQTVATISRRFQNLRGPGDRDPLAHLEIDPLRPLNNILWGYLQDEQNRLSVRRRAYEYDHHYGLTLYGKVVPRLRPADSRSKFLEGFHNLLNLASVFFKEDNNTTVIANGFPLLNALKECISHSPGRTTSSAIFRGPRAPRCCCRSGSWRARRCAISCRAAPWCLTKRPGSRKWTP